MRPIGLFFAAVLLASSAPNLALEKAISLRQSGKLIEARAALQTLLTTKSLPDSDRAQSLSELSQIELAEGHYPAAIQNCTHAIDLFRATHDRTGEGNSLTVKGLAQLYAGSYSEAFASLNPALAIARETHDPRAEITRLNNIGTIFYFQGDYGRATQNYQAAMRLVEQHAAEPWSPSRRQLTVANLATVYQRLGAYNQALDAYRGIRQAGNSLPPSEEAQLLANMGALYRRLGDPVKALETYRAAQSLYRSRAMRNGEIAILNNIGIALALDLHQYPEALANFDRALAMARQSGDKPVEVHALLYRAETLYRMSNPADSDAEFTRADNLATSLHATEERWKALYGLARNHPQSPEAVAHLAQAATLIESLRGSGPATLRAGFLADKRQVYDLLLAESWKTPNRTPSTLLKLVEQTHSRALQDKTAHPASLEALQKSLPPRTLVLDYWLADNAAALLWVTANRTGTAYIPNQPALRARLRKFAATLNDPASSSWSAEARALGTLLLPQIPASIDRIIVIPDRELAGIPFEVLSPPGQPPLIETAAVSYFRAATLVTAAPHDQPVRPFWKSTLLAFANPSGGSSAGAISPVNPLPSAEREVKDAARALGGQSSLYLGPRAQKQCLTTPLTPLPPVLHFATHAVSDTEDPARSYILFAPETPNGISSYLYLKEAAALKLQNVSLVTISACDTSTGKLIEGEGIESFGGAFLDAGAKAVVATLWPVGDRSTATLMQHFYSALASGQTVAQALRAAKLQTRNNGQPHPFYWAGFIANGDAEIRLPHVISALTTAAAALVLLALAALAFRTVAKRASRSRPSHPPESPAPAQGSSR